MLDGYKLKKMYKKANMSFFTRKHGVTCVYPWSNGIGKDNLVNYYNIACQVKTTCGVCDRLYQGQRHTTDLV